MTTCKFGTVFIRQASVRYKCHEQSTLTASYVWVLHIPVRSRRRASKNPFAFWKKGEQFGGVLDLNEGYVLCWTNDENVCNPTIWNLEECYCWAVSGIDEGFNCKLVHQDLNKMPNIENRLPSNMELAYQVSRSEKSSSFFLTIYWKWWQLSSKVWQMT